MLHLLTARAGGQDKIEAVAKLLLEQEKIDAEDVRKLIGVRPAATPWSGIRSETRPLVCVFAANFYAVV